MKLNDAVDVLRFLAGRFGDSTIRRQVSRAITIAARQVDPNNQAAQDWAETHEEQDHA